MIRNKSRAFSMCWVVVILLVPLPAELSYEAALQLLEKGNQSLKIADKGIEIARSERGRLNAFWYPSLQSSGAYVHLSEQIEVKQPLSQFTDPAKEYVHSLIPDDQIISGILDQIGTNTLIFPLAPRNLTTVDLTAEWVLFAGGKRVGASRIGNTLVELAHTSRAQVSATQQTLLAESYYGLRLAQEIIAVREEVARSLQKHYENALKLEAVGMIDKAGRLFAQVNRDEAARELEAARKDELVVQQALKTLLNLEADEQPIRPSSPLFMHDSLPPKEVFAQAVASGNYELNRLHLQEQMARQ